MTIMQSYNLSAVYHSFKNIMQKSCKGSSLEGGNSDMEQTGMLVGNFEFNP